MSTAPSANNSRSSNYELNLQELQETVSRLSSHKGVDSVLILNRKGDIVVESGTLSKQQQQQQQAPSSANTDDDSNTNSTSTSASVQHAKRTHQLLATATAYLQSLQPEDEVSFLQLRSKNQQELMIAPHQGYVLAVLKRS